MEVDKTKKYALLISGGVDSAVACHLMCQQGLKPDLFYIKIGMQGEGTSCSAEEDIELSTLTAKKVWTLLADYRLATRVSQSCHSLCR